MASVTPPSSYTPPAGTTAQAPADGEAVSAPVERLPPSLSSTDRALTLRGEVVAQNQDGTTRIATPRGPVDVRMPDPAPAKGTNVEVSLPAGTPPRTATVTLPAQQPQQPAPQVPVTQTPVPQPQTPAVTLPAAPLPQTPTPQAPTPQTSLPQAPATQPTLPGTTPAPAGNAPPAPALPSGIALLQQANETEISPRGLLDFLKTSMQTFMKSEPGAMAQRPLQLGQLTRLTPLPAGQALAQPQGPATPGTTAGTPVAGTPVLAQTIGAKALTVAGALLQNPATAPTQAAMTGAALAGTAAFTGAPPARADAVTRILMPMMQNAMPKASGTLIPSGQTGTPQLAGALHAGMPVLPRQMAVTAPLLAPQMPAPQALDVRVSAMMPQMPASMAANPNAATLLHGTPATPVLFATVAGQTAQGLPVIELPTFTSVSEGLKGQPAMMVLQFPARGLAPATVLQLDVLQGPQMSAPAANGMAVGEDGITWEALDDVLRGIPGQAGGTPVAAAVQAGLPKPGAAAFAAPVLMFVAALRGGDIMAWMGERGLDGIGRTSRRADALARIAGDFAATAKKLIAEEAKPQGEWRSLQLPMMHGDDMMRINLHYRSFEREDDADKQSGRKTTGTRFIMDLSLTRMGEMQVDGFSIGKKLDVTLRTEQNMSAGMRESMRQRYHSAVSNIGFAGELNFAAAADHKNWVATDAPQPHVTRQG